MRLIDADAFRDCIKESAIFTNEYTQKSFEIMALELIDKQPTTEERPHGEWIPLGEPDSLCIHSWYKCSSCGFRTTWHMIDIFRYCPNCGADMRKEGE